MIFGTVSEITVTEVLKSVVEIGIVPVLLIILIFYFIQSNKSREKQLESERAAHQKQLNSITKLSQENMENTNRLAKRTDGVLSHMRKKSI